eukprot:314099-Amphidinium_carterae.1
MASQNSLGCWEKAFALEPPKDINTKSTMAAAGSTLTGDLIGERTSTLRASTSSQQHSVKVYKWVSPDEFASEVDDRRNAGLEQAGPRGHQRAI